MKNDEYEVKTPWVYDTSEEFGASIAVFSGAEGKIYFVHESTGQKFTVRYSCFGIGISKGAVLNISESLTKDPSGPLGFTNVMAKQGYGFGPSSFPCWGWIETIGGTAGIFQPSFLSHSGLAIGQAYFGFNPSARARFWGRFNSIMPSIGPSGAVCKFELA